MRMKAHGNQGGRSVRRLVQVGILAGVLSTVLGVSTMTAYGQTAPGNVTYSGSASALAAQLTLKAPQFPVADTPVDGGGPTAQVMVDSLGASAGYAAFPDPGQLVITSPGLLTFFLNSNGVPLTSPNYPFYVQSDSEHPDQSVGSGPYQLSAKSGDGSSTAAATAGFQATPAGNVALISSLASLAPSGRNVVTRAVSDVQGLTIGPLTIGEIKTTATMTLDEFGQVTPTAEMEITGARVGGIPVSITPSGVLVGNESVPVEMPSLERANISVRVLAAEQYPGRIVGPVLRITFPIPAQTPGPLGGGVATLTLGFATASFTASTAPGVGIGLPPLTPALGEISQQPPSVVGFSPGTFNLPPSSGGSTPAQLAARGVGGRMFDIGGLYLLIVAGGVTAPVLAQLVRLAGGRKQLAWRLTNH